MKNWISASALALTAILISTSVAFAAPNIGPFESNDGTYDVQSVTSIEACTALCDADKAKCRGTVLLQPDTTKPDMLCRLNNGFGETAVFPRKAPEPLGFDQAISDLNRYRISQGLEALIYSEKLNLAAEAHASDLASAGITSHTGTDGSGHGDRIQRQGYYFSIATENVATGQMSWQAVFEAWQKSPGHNKNMLRDDVTHFGLALAYEPTKTPSTYWVTLFAEPLDISATTSTN